MSATSWEIRQHAQYAASVFAAYIEALPTEYRTLDGLRILEIGPGHSLGTAALLAERGAAVTVVDKYLPRWDTAYHGRFFEALAAHAVDRFGIVATHWCRTARNFPEAIQLWPTAIESLSTHANSEGVFDIVLSNAVLEHISDVEQTALELARATREGGVGIHQIDMRDHRDFDEPLEYLTLSQAEFEALFERSHGECGNRLRLESFLAAFSSAGFDIVSFTPTIVADDEYLRSLQPRLSLEQRSHTHRDLSTLSGRLHVKRR